MLLVIGGVHTGLFYLLAVLQVSPLMQTNLILLYWLLVATLLSWLARRCIRTTYDEPMQKLAEASRRLRAEIFPSMFPPFIRRIGTIIWIT